MGVYRRAKVYTKNNSKLLEKFSSCCRCRCCNDDIIDRQTQRPSANRDHYWYKSNGMFSSGPSLRHLIARAERRRLGERAHYVWKLFVAFLRSPNYRTHNRIHTTMKMIFHIHRSWCARRAARLLVLAFAFPQTVNNIFNTGPLSSSSSS